VPIAMNGHIVRGLGAATNTIQLQKPFMRNFFPVPRSRQFLFQGRGARAHPSRQEFPKTRLNAKKSNFLSV